MHLVGFIIRIHRDAWSPECEMMVITPSTCFGHFLCPKHVEFYSKNKFEKLMHLVGFIIRMTTMYFLVLCLISNKR